MKQLKNNRGEGQISVGVKIILAVVIGALILGGLYLLFDRVILRNTDRQIKELMAAGGSSEALEVRTTDDRALLTSLSYTHDGVTWIPSEIKRRKGFDSGIGRHGRCSGHALYHPFRQQCGRALFHRRGEKFPRGKAMDFYREIRCKNEVECRKPTL